MQQNTGVAVVGAGIMGCAAAWHLARRGEHVTLFERFALDHRRGSSHGEARIFRFAYDQPEYVRLAMDALPLWREIEAALGVTLLEITGGLDLGPPASLAPVAAALASVGARSTMLTRAAFRERFQAISIPVGWEALYQPDAGVLRANACRAGLIDLAREAGAEICAEVRVDSLTPQADGVRLDTGAGAWHAGRAVVTAAGWSNQLLAPLGLEVPLTVTREQVAYYRRGDAAPICPFIWHGETAAFDFYGLPNGARDEIKIGEHGTGPVVDPDEYGGVDEARLVPLNSFVCEHLPGLVPASSSAETCLYAATPDDDFVIDVSGPIVLGVGFGGHGFKFGAVIGAMLADLATGAASPRQRFSLARFTKPTDTPDSL